MGLASSLGLGLALSLPRARVAELSSPMVVVGLSQAGIHFDAPDGQPANVIFLLLTPQSDPSLQLDLSASISHAFRDPEGLRAALRATNFTEFLAALKSFAPRHSQSTVPETQTGEVS